MASGDTKTEAMLNALGNGGSADEFRGCCNTKTQQYILDAIDRVQNVEDEVEELKNNPDVVDIVDTYADLQAYDTQHLTENDIIRVLQDETHSGNSTYYRFTKNPDTWTFVGEIAGGGGGTGEAKVLTVDDYNYDKGNTGTNNCVAMWLLPPGLYSNSNGVNIIIASNYSFNTNNRTYLVSKSDSANHDNVQILYFKGASLADRVLYTVNSLGTGAILRNFLTNADIVNGLNSSDTALPLSANQGKVLNERIGDLSTLTTTDKTSAVAAINELAQGGGGGGGAIELTSADYDYPDANPTGVALWRKPAGVYWTKQGVRVFFSTNDYNASGSTLIVANSDYNYYVDIIYIYGAGGSNTYKAFKTVKATGAADSTYINQAFLLENRIQQTTGTSTSDVMSQNATTSMVFADPATRRKVSIGDSANAAGTDCISIGPSSNVLSGGTGAVSIGDHASASGVASIALGYHANATERGQMDISTGTYSSGYSNTKYRLLTGLYDPQNAHDAATKGYVDGLVGNIEAALNVINNGGN